MLGALIRRGSVRSDSTISVNDYLEYFAQFGFNGVQYAVPASSSGAITMWEAMRNPVIQAAIILRAHCLSQIRFMLRPVGGGPLSDAPSLDLLRRPWPNASAGELVSRMEFDGSLTGNSYWRAQDGVLIQLDPLKVDIVTTDALGPTGQVIGKELVGYVLKDKYNQPGEFFFPEDLIHYRPIPDPQNPFRGLSWLSALLPDVIADRDMSRFRSSFLNNGASPSLVITLKNNIGEDAFKKFKERLESGHTGTDKAFKPLYLGAGADVKVVGSNWSDLQLADNQAYGETRLALAAGVPPSLLGISEGLKGTTLNTANYASSKRRFSDITIRPLWKIMCSAVDPVVKHAPGKEVWYEDREIPFLMADQQDSAKVRQSDAVTIVNLTNAGFTPESIIEAVKEDDLGKLVHSGSFSVQLQEPVTDAPTDAPTPSDSGDNGDQNDNAS